jgi:PAS domain S-box-containing protein
MAGERHTGGADSPLDDPRVLSALVEVFLRDVDDGLILADVETQRFLGMNDSFCRMVGYPREELIGRTPFELDLYPFPEDLEAYFDAISRSRESVAGDVRVRRADGDIRLTEGLMRFVEVDGRSLVLGIARDVTERRRAEEALRENEAAARALFEENPVPMWVWDPVELRPLDVNEAALRQYGYTREEFLAMSLMDLRPEHERERFRLTVAELLESREELAYFGTWRHLRKDGSELDVDVWSRVLERGDRKARIAIGIDVTDRLAAEAALKDAEQRYRQLVESIPACVSLERIGDRRMIYVGPVVEGLLGYPLTDWYSGAVGWRSILHPDDAERVIAASDDLNEHPRRFSDEYRVLASDGRTVWVRDESVPIFDGEGRLESWLGFWVDITDQKEAERALREAEERYRVLVEAMPAAVYLDRIAPYEVLYTSPRIEEMTGYPAEDWVSGRVSWHDVVHPDDRERVHAASDERDADPAPYFDEYRILAADGRVVWVRDQAVPLTDETGRPAYWQGFWVDITEQKQAESALLRAQGERRELLARLVAAGEAERTRIAEDLHDAPIQSLTAAQLRLESLKERVAEADQDVLDKSLESVTASIRSLRKMMFDLQPRTLDRDGLAATLRQHLMTLFEDQGMEVAIRSTLDSEPSACAPAMKET